MKKVLWTLSALALAGLCFTSCDEETMNNLFGDPEEWSPVSNEDFCDGSCGNAEDGNADAPNCFSNDITKGDDVDYTFCSACSVNCGMKYKGTTPTCVQGDVVLGGGWGCASAGTCAAGQGFKVTGEIAKCEPLDVNQCDAESGCGEGYHCDLDAGLCVEDEVEEDNNFKFVRIEDLSGKCQNSKGETKFNDDGICTLDDPGADIDAVILVKKNGDVKYATDVVGYKRSDLDGTFKILAEIKALNKDGVSYTAADPTKILGAPDSFDTYGSAYDGTCNYWVDPQAAEKVHPYVSLGGSDGWIEVQMGGNIEAGDKLDILEVGECKLKNTTDGGSQTAQADKVKVLVSITSDEGTWKAVGEATPDSNNKGILTFSISDNMLK